MNLDIIGAIGILVLVLTFFSAMPVGFAMALWGIIGFTYVVSLEGGLNIIATDLFNTFNSYTLTVVPMFVLMGSIAFYSGMSERLFNAAYRWIGHVRGGLAMATIAACAGFGAMCGSTNASAAAMGKVCLPEMQKYNYAASVATGTVAAGGSLGILIPPSTIFIIYGVIVGESIGKLFIAGILPGIVLACLWMLTIYVECFMNPNLCPVAEKASFGAKLASLKGIIELSILSLLIMGGLFVGIFTPTEAGAIGAGGALVIALVRKKLSWHSFVAALDDSARLTCMILIIVGGATIFSHFLTVTQMPYNIATWVGKLGLSPFMTMCLIIFIYFVAGCFLEILPVIILTIPIFHPIVVKMGFDPIWFGVIIVLITQMGVITPPVGVNVYVVKGIAQDVPIGTIFRGAMPFLIGLVLLCLILIFFPGLPYFCRGSWGKMWFVGKINGGFKKSGLSKY